MLSTPSPAFPEKLLRSTEPHRPASLLPDFKIEALTCAGRSIVVVREDLLIGGTKQRACVPYLEDLIREGVEEFVYASPFAGFAQVALAISARSLGKSATIFCERDATYSGAPRLHEFSKLAMKHGAQMVLVDTLGRASAKAVAYARERIGRAQLPLGFDCVSFRNYLKREVTRAWSQIESQAGSNRPRTLWVPVGSGTLLKTFHEILPADVRIRGVNVRVLENSDPRIAGLTRIDRCELFSTPERFEEPSRLLPPVPSNVHYDAKLWQFMEKHAEAGDVWWNVAR